jgi:hypothetical protein
LPEVRQRGHEEDQPADERGWRARKGAQFGAAYFYNYGIPVMTLFFAVLIAMLFIGQSFLLGIAVFAGIVYAGFRIRASVKAKVRSPFADLPDAMKRDGFRCNRCEHMFIPTDGG